MRFHRENITPCFTVEHDALDEFIEDIPIFQTRNYVKKVMTNYAVYHYIFYGKVYDGMNFKLPTGAAN